MSRYGFYIDSASCSGCKTCQVACKDKNDLGAGIRFRRVYEISGGSWKKTEENAWIPEVIAYNLSVSCNHCANPSCVAACPTGAMHSNDDGTVTIETGKCIGCRYCQWACPYAAPQFDQHSGNMRKCDFCHDYLKEGRTPVCVSSCPMRALDFGTMERLQAVHPGTAGVFPLPDPGLTDPSVIIRPHPLAGKAEASGAKIINREEVANG